MITVRKEQLYRYLGYRGGVQPDAEVLERIAQCEPQMQEAVTPRSLLMRVPVVRTAEADSCSGREQAVLTIAGMEICSKDLQKNLEDCKEVFLFAATLGPGPDLLIRRASAAQRMSDAVIYQAMSAEMIESYCDENCAQLREKAVAEGLYLKPRFSPGYGDLPLTLQKDLLRILDAPKKIGLTLTDSLLMMPSKSVTALIGLTRRPQPDHEKDCVVCPKTDCAFRRE